MGKVEVKVFEWKLGQEGELTDDNIKERVILSKNGEGKQFSVGEALNGKEVFVYFRALQGWDFGYEVINYVEGAGIEIDDNESGKGDAKGESRFLIVINREKGRMVSANQIYD